VAADYRAGRTTPLHLESPGPTMTADRSAASDPAAPTQRSVANLGRQLRRVRQDAGLSAREVARQLEVSPSFISQIETGRSQPSVATLYALAQLLDITIDELFGGPGGSGSPTDAPVPTDASRVADLHGHEHGTRPDEAHARISVVRRGERATLRLQSGVCWEQLAATSDHDLNFMEVVYPVGSASTEDASMLRHQGYEYHHVQRGVLEVTVNFEVHTLGPGDSMGFDSSLPHLLRNPGEVDTHCIVTVHRCSGA
jgi:transcriptional regulator with XRE-family HTH domain